MSALEEPSERRELQWTLGDRMRKSRVTAGIKSTERMAALLNAKGIRCGGSTVGAWEADVNPPRTQRAEDGSIAFDTFDILEAWAEITNVSTAFLKPFGGPMDTGGFTSMPFDLPESAPEAVVLQLPLKTPKSLTERNDSGRKGQRELERAERVPDMDAGTALRAQDHRGLPVTLFAVP